MKKLILIILASSTLLTACNRRDTKLARAVRGSWAHGTHAITISPDGSFYESFQPPKGTLIYRGTWKIKHGILSFTVTNVSGPEPHEPVGSVDRGKIVSVDSDNLVYKSQGQTISLSR